MKYTKKPLEKKKAVTMYLKGFTQKEISEKLNVTEKTVGCWLKELKDKYAKNQQNIEDLGIRIRELINTPDSDTNDIKNIAIAIERLEKIWHKELIKI